MSDQLPTVPFEPARHLTRVGGNDYLEVKWRLVWMRNQHPDAMVRTELLSHNDNTAVFRAIVEISGGGCAYGHGSETASDFRDYLEKAETKAIGRALAALGFGTQFCGDFDYGTATGRVVDSPVKSAPRAERSNGRQEANAGPQRVKTAAPLPPGLDLPPVMVQLDNEPTIDAQGLAWVHGIGSDYGYDHETLTSIVYPLYHVRHLNHMTKRMVKDLKDRLKTGDLRDAVMPPPDGDPVERNEVEPQEVRT